MTAATEALRLGVLGAARIVPAALIRPARAVDGVRVVALAARDVARAQLFADKHGIERVHPGYQALIDDPELDALYNPLPNGLHCEWSVRALEAGKHVLCEKPIAANEREAQRMAQSGAEHPGHDCFVFRRALWRRMAMGNVFLGFPAIGRTLAKQLMAAGNAQVLRNSALTFHVGQTKRVTQWLKHLGWAQDNASVDRNDAVHHEHSQLNRFFCKQALTQLKI